MEDEMKRAWAEVDLDAIAHNIKQVRGVVGNKTKIMAVVKADGYGHGFWQVSKTLIKNGADALAVAVVDEAIQLRSRGIEVPILVLGPTPVSMVKELIAFDITATAFSYEFAEILSDEAKKQETVAKIHVKIDTGMGRIGYVWYGDNGSSDEDTLEEISKIYGLDNIEIEGIFTHFARADEPLEGYTKIQLNLFLDVCKKLKEIGINIKVKHAANSAAIMEFEESWLDMVRPGIILYGLYPSQLVDKSKLDLLPAMCLKAKITMVKQLKKDKCVSYGSLFKTNAVTTIATIPIGYADGYSRTLNKKAQMLVRDSFDKYQMVDVVGSICMDQCMIDISNTVGVCQGDEVILLGRCGKGISSMEITADQIAQRIGTINYEIVCVIGKRIPRIYLSKGKPTTILNYLH